MRSSCSGHKITHPQQITWFGFHSFLEAKIVSNERKKSFELIKNNAIKWIWMCVGINLYMHLSLRSLGIFYFFQNNQIWNAIKNTKTVFMVELFFLSNLAIFSPNNLYFERWENRKKFKTLEDWNKIVWLNENKYKQKHRIEKNWQNRKQKRKVKE